MLKRIKLALRDWRARKRVKDPVGTGLLTAPDFPPGYNKQNPPPSGFKDEPEVYEDVNYAPDKVAQSEKFRSYEKQRREAEIAAVEKTADHLLLNNPDAMYWATEFVRIRQEQLALRGVDIAASPGVMVGWFANAFQRGEWNSRFYQEWVDNYFKENKLGKYANE